MKYYLVAGEASGDLHASNLMQGILDHDPNAEFRFFGGDLMAGKGGTLVKHYREMAFMGFLEVLMNIRKISKNINFCKKDIVEYKPDVVILIDYPGFNLRIAKFAKQNRLRVFYYIAPKVWAWKESRVNIIKRYVDRLYVIFPFEVDYFKKHNIDVVYEGNPLNDAIACNSGKESFDDFIHRNGLAKKPIIALLAGSRRQELKYNLPVMLTLEPHFKDYQLVIAGAPSLKYDDYQPYLLGSDAKLIFGQTQQLLNQSTLAVVTSGTATLEAALLNIPEVVCYRGNSISMFIAWLVIKVKYISLVNLIMGKEVVRELKQFDLTPKSLFNEVKSLLPGEKKRELMLSDFNELQNIIGTSGSSGRVAKHMVETIS
jgi:lipid-A-disaccharide synthase